MNAGGLTTTVSLISFTFTDSDYDDVTTQTLIGSEVVSGLIFPIRGKQGSEEAMLMEQGKLLTKDKVLYTGSVNTSGNILVDIQGEKYTIINEGVKDWGVTGSTIYTKLFLRHTIPGSLF